MNNVITKATTNLILISVLSIVTGWFYIEGIWFSYSFLGPEAGSERETVRFWGSTSILFGLAFIVATILWFKKRKPIADRMIVILLGLIFLIQLPPVMLWFLFYAYKGLIPHLVLILAIMKQISYMRKIRNEIDE